MILFRFHLLDEDEDEDSFQFLVRANNICEWAWKIYFKLTMVSVVIGFIVSNTISVVLCYIKYGSFDANNSYHAMALR